MFALDKPIIQITRIREQTAKRLNRLGIETVEDLIFYFPFRHEDLSEISDIASLQPGTNATVRATIELLKNRRSPVKKRMLTEAVVFDDTGSLKVIWFNQSFITKNLKPGDEVYLSGKVGEERYALQLLNPVYEKVNLSGTTTHTARIVPIYSLTSGVTQKQLRYFIKLALSSVSQVVDWMPLEIVKNDKLMELSAALEQVHFPQDMDMLARAMKRLKFDELFLFQLQMQRVKSEHKASNAVPVPFDEDLVTSFVKNLPFTLTQEQRATAWQVLQDLQKPHPMNRLVEGEVGSGKTVVATIAMLNVANAGMQSVLMAPTEILAIQHNKTITTFLDATKNVTVGLLTRSEQQLDGKSVTKKQLTDAIAKGEVNVLIGTHALIQEKLSFNRLVLAVVDEQHRFGVKQRQLLRRASGDHKTSPHLLSMTATPIPRSLALAMYGDLDLSIIRQLPKERKPVLTEVIEPADRDQAYQFIREEVQAGRQTFVVCPLIDPSDKLGVRCVTDEYSKLTKDVFPKLKIGMVHGKLKPKDKERVMQDFTMGELDIIVTTSVVEVGVDVPNATVMLIEGAERFGLAQLHQFRGRVGRSTHQAHCFLFPETLSSKIKARLQALVSSNDGLALAQKDLEFRGPGQMYGTQQSGWPEFRLAEITDLQTLTQAKQAVEKLVAQSPDFKNYPELQKKIDTMVKKVHLE